MIRRSYWNHMEHNIVGDGDEPASKVQKNFWNHIKASKKDRVGTAPLKENGILVTDPKTKESILNRNTSLLSVKKILQKLSLQ